MFEVEERHAQGLCDGRRNGVVLVKRRKLVAPSVESEIQDRKLWRLLALYKNRAVVPTPWLIGENVKKLNAFGRAGAEKFSDSLLLICATDIDADNLRARKCLHHFNEGRDHAIVGSGKAVATGLRPGNPSRFVQFPFGRHAITFF